MSEQRPTPITDKMEAALARSSNVTRYYNALAQMRLMEVERDEARRCAEEWREHCLKRHVMSQIVSSKLPWEEDS